LRHDEPDAKAGGEGGSASDFNIKSATPEKNPWGITEKATGNDSIPADRHTDSSTNGRNITAYNKPGFTQSSSEITIINDNPDVLAREVGELAAGFTGEEHLKTNQTKIEATVGIMEAANTFNIKVLYAQYADFVALLKSKYGLENIKAGEVRDQDITETIEELNNSLKQLDNSISTAGENGSAPDELADLRMQRDHLAGQIENYRNDSNYVYISVKIQKKQ
jgi:hypothetical protein